jgi:alanine dehydrogenase
MHLSSMAPIAELGTDAILEADRLVVSSEIREEHRFRKPKHFPLVDRIAAGRLAWDDVDELGDVMVGCCPGREALDGITLFHESQGAFGDLVFAAFVYAEARRRGLGREFKFSLVWREGA